MNKVLSAAAAATALAAIASCSGGFKTSTLEETGRYPLTEGATDSIEISIHAEYPSAGTGREAIEAITKCLNASLFGEQYAMLPAEDAMQAYTDDNISEYRQANIPLLEASEGLPHASLSWSDYTSGTVAGRHDGILSYSITKYAFTGGAHGMTAETALNFDMKTGSLLTEGDFFKEGYEERVSELLSSRLAGSLENPADTSALFTRSIGPNGNFMVSPEGVTYIYNQYEIAPYSMGIIRVCIPWDELEGLY